MGLIVNSAALKAYSEQITSPRSTAVDATPYVRPSRHAFATNNSIFTPREDYAEQSAEQKDLDDDNSPDIPKNVLRILEYKIVYKCDTAEEKEKAECAQNGGLTNLQLHMAITLAIDNVYYPTPDPYLSVEQPKYKIVVPPHHNAGQTFSGRDGKSYTPIVDKESGQIAYYDTGESCVMNVGGWSATTKPMTNDDLISKSQIYNITFKVDAQGNETRRTPEDANFQLAMTRLDNQYTVLPYQLDGVNRFYAEMAGSNTFKSAAPSGIKTDTKPAEPFAAAVTDTAPAAASKSIMFKAREPLPWDKKAVAANAPTFEPTL